MSRFGKTAEISHELSFAAAKTVSVFEISGDGLHRITRLETKKAGTFAPVAVRVTALSGEELFFMPDAAAMTCASIATALEDKNPLLPGHEYKLVQGDAKDGDQGSQGDAILRPEQQIGDVAGESLEVRISAVVQAKPSMQEDLNLALIEAADSLDLNLIGTLLKAGANAAFVHDPPGTWGSCDSKSALHVAIQRQPRSREEEDSTSPCSKADHWKAVIMALLDANADVNAKRRQSDWRGCGSSCTAFEMILPSAMQDAPLLQAFLAAKADPNTESRRSVHSMRSDGGSRHCVLHTAVSSQNLDVVKTLLDAKADANATKTENISNERGYHRDMCETSLHIACECGDVKTSALLLMHGADANAIRKDLIQEDIPEAELFPHKSSKSKSSKKMMCDDPRDPDYVCPVRCIPVKESALHIALQNKHVPVVALLACAGADVSFPRQQGETKTSAVDLCQGDPSLLCALSTTWPIPSDCQQFADDDLASVEAAMSSLGRNPVE